MIGVRLKEERERLRLTQPDFAQAAGAAKRTLIEWEKGTTSPSAVQLSALEAIGVDVYYVLTGKHLNQLPATSEAYQPPLAATMNQPPATVTAYLSYDEAALLDNYRNSSLDGRAAIKATSAALTKSSTAMMTSKSEEEEALLARIRAANRSTVDVIGSLLSADEARRSPDLLKHKKAG